MYTKMLRFVINRSEIGKFKILDREKGKFIATFKNEMRAVKYIKKAEKELREKNKSIYIYLVDLDKYDNDLAF